MYTISICYKNVTFIYIIEGTGLGHATFTAIKQFKSDYAIIRHPLTEMNLDFDATAVITAQQRFS